MSVRALLWDVDGVLAETERDGHRVAFNLAFAAHGLAWHWDVSRYGELLSVAGGRERLLHDMQTRRDAPAAPEDRASLAQRVHQTKNQRYADLIQRQGIPLRDGVRELMEECRSRGLRMGIATTTSRRNVDALLRTHLGPGWATGFAALACGEDVARKKPDPQVYRVVLDQLGLGPSEALAIEDSPAGVAAACAAGLPVVATRSAYFAAAALPGAVAIGPNLGQRQAWQPAPADGALQGRVSLDDLLAWRHAGAPKAQGDEPGQPDPPRPSNNPGCPGQGESPADRAGER